MTRQKMVVYVILGVPKYWVEAESQVLNVMISITYKSKMFLFQSLTFGTKYANLQLKNY
jgi:hypothetical protein